MIHPDVRQPAPMFYGKGGITVYRTGSTPLQGLPSIPESPVTGRNHGLLAVEVGLSVSGLAFTPAYTHGDNRAVVATDSMKNFVLRHAAEYHGATLEGFLHFIGRRLLDTYPQMERLHIAGRELPFAPVTIPGAGGDGFETSNLLLRRTHDAHATAALELVPGSATAAGLSGLAGLQLVKLRGNSFAGFVRDAYTTLPDLSDRTLFTYMDLTWRYQSPEDGLGTDPARYVAAFQVQDVAQAVCHTHESRSIQELIYALGERLLQRYPPLSEVQLTAQNRTWDTAIDGDSGGVRVLTDPRPPHGILSLRLRREDLRPHREDCR